MSAFIQLWVGFGSLDKHGNMYKAQTCICATVVSYSTPENQYLHTSCLKSKRRFCWRIIVSLLFIEMGKERLRGWGLWKKSYNLISEMSGRRAGVRCESRKDKCFTYFDKLHLKSKDRWLFKKQIDNKMSRVAITGLYSKGTDGETYSSSSIIIVHARP